MMSALICGSLVRMVRTLQMCDDIIPEHMITKMCMYWLGFKSTIDRSQSISTSVVLASDINVESLRANLA